MPSMFYASFNYSTSSDLPQYDLRAVLVHTGLPGRKQMYSYVQDTESTWWKTVDHEVTEVNLLCLVPSFTILIVLRRCPKRQF